MQVAFKITARATEETLRRLAQERSAAGAIFLQVNEVSFPQQSWDDFVLSVLGAWIDNAMLFRYGVIELENSFHDGPFAFRIRREMLCCLGECTITIRLYHNDRKVRHDKIEITFRQYLAALRRPAKSILATLEKNDAAVGREVEYLRRKLNELQEFQKEMGL